MEFCNGIDERSSDDFIVKLQLFLDALTAIAHFAVPLRLIYSIRILPVFPHKFVFIYFGTFTILCGATYVSNLWRYSQYSETSALIIMIVQVCAAAASWLTVVVMYFVIPNLLHLQESECLLKNKVEELSREKSVVLHEVATERSILLLINEIRSTLNGQHIVKSTVIGLGQVFDLEECSFWLPSPSNKTLQLYYSLNNTISVGSVVPMSLPVVAEICNNIGAVKIQHTCPLVRDTKFTKGGMTSEVVAVRVPLVDFSFTESDNSLNGCTASYAAIVLILPLDNIRKFNDYELELLGAVAEQVSVSLAHASAIEESKLVCDYLKKQNSSLDLTSRDMEIAGRTLDDLKNGIIRQLEMPLYAMTLLSSFLLETTLTPLQREMAEMVLKSSNFLETLVQNERDLSELQYCILELNPMVFNLSDAIQQTVDKIKPVAAVKKLSLSLVLSPDLPVYALGDQERLMQVILNIIGNAVKFTKEGHISVTASVVNPKTYRALKPFKFHLVSSNVHYYLRIQVEDSGCGIDPHKIPNLFHPSNLQSSGKLGFAICKRLLKVMEGGIWIESEGLGKGTTATIIVKLGTIG